MVCLGCNPAGLIEPPTNDAVPTRREGVRLAREYNLSIHGYGAGHQHVVLGCAGPKCLVNPLSILD